MSRFLIVSCALLSSLLCYASPLTPEEALSRIESNNTRSIRDVKLIKTLKYKEDPTLYIFDYQQNNGFIVVSADDRVVPLLGYSETNDIDPDNLSPELEYWLGEYSRQIEYMRETGMTSTRAGIDLPEWESVEPLLKTMWDQESPYNDLCPVLSEKNSQGVLQTAKAPTGCVATSMSQIMKYYNWPAQGKGSISYKYNQTEYSLDFSQITFDWSNMLDSYRKGSYNSVQANAVATLMKAAGYSVEMQYGLDGSGAYSSLITNALINYFSYDPGIRYYYRTWYHYSDWCKMIYDNLKEGSPVIYNGSGSGGSHSFIFDGYENNGYFHVNWGWSGSGNGYYRIDALDPSYIGTGGGTGGFNFGQGVVMNIRPDSTGNPGKPQELIYAYGTVSGKVDLNILNVFLTDTDLPGVVFQGMGPADMQLGVKIEERATENAEPVILPATNDFSSLEYDNMSGYYIKESDPMQVNLSKAGLQNNIQYKVTLVYRSVNGEWQDMNMDQGYSNCFYMTKTGVNFNAKYTIENVEVLQFDASDLEVITEFYQGMPLEFKGTLTNNNDEELTRTASLVLGTMEKGGFSPVFLGDNFVYSLAPGQSVTETWITEITPYNQQTNPSNYVGKDFQIGLFDYETGYIYYLSDITIKMHAAPEFPTIKVKTFIEDAKIEDRVYIVEDPYSFQVSTEITVEKGWYFYQTYMLLFAPSEDNTGYYVSVDSFPYELTSIEEGQTGKMTTEVSFPQAEEGVTYGLLGYTYYNNNLSSLTEKIETLFRIKNSFVSVDSPSLGDGDILFFHNKMNGTLTVSGSNGLVSVGVYSLNGTKLTSVASSGSEYIDVNLDTVGTGVVVVTASDKKGNQRSIKIAL